MRIAIVEDIAEERKLLRSRLETQFEKRGIYAELVEFENGEDFLAAAKECSFPNIVFGYLHEWRKWG